MVFWLRSHGGLWLIGLGKQKGRTEIERNEGVEREQRERESKEEDSREIEGEMKGG